MRYNVSQLLKGHTGEIREFQVAEPLDVLDDTLKPVSDLTGEVQLLRTHEGILARADLRTNVELTCSRCLTEFIMPVRFRVEEEFFPTIDILTGARLPATPDTDPATLIDAHHILDLSEVVRQDLTLALPMVPICRSNCKGLCPTCGKNWNDGDCKCEPETMDPRFAILKELLDEPNQSN